MNKMNIRLSLIALLTAAGLMTVGCASKESRVCSHFVDVMTAAAGEAEGEEAPSDEEIEEVMGECEEELAAQSECDKYSDMLDCMLEIEVPDGELEGEEFFALMGEMGECQAMCEAEEEEAEEEEAEEEEAAE